MAFTVRDMPDLTRILLDHPEWLAEVRRLVLTDELLNLPSLVRELAALQQRGEQQMDRVEKAIIALIAAQQQNEQQIANLIAAQQQTEQRIDELTTAQRRTEQNVERLDKSVERLDKSVERLDRTLQTVRGSELEQRYTRHAPGYFGKWLRRIKVIHPYGVMPEFEDLLYNQLSNEEVHEILLLDAILRGNLHQPTTRPEIYLALEVSVTIEAHDVQRAQARSALLRKAGLPAIPVVAGERLDDQADALAHNTPIVVVQNGRSWGWDESVAAYTETSA